MTKMFYAKLIENKFDSPTVYDGPTRLGTPYNFTLFAFETKAARQEAIDKKWNDGGNGFKVTRKDVDGYLGEFTICSDGRCVRSPEGDTQHADMYEESIAPSLYL
jgi:hypothetical protein